MNKPPVRHLSALLVVLGLAFLAPPSADSRPLAALPDLHTETGWMPAVAGWLASLFSATRASVAGPALRSTSSAVSTEPTTPSDGGPVIHTNTGACIDPNGRPAPCGQG
jgi:hypothetical protein